MRILAIDYGEKRIGLALSDPLRIFAKPFQTLNNLSYEQILAELQRIIVEYVVTDVIVGIPWSIDGTETPKTKETIAFMEKLKQDLNIPVQGRDERYTTGEANDLLKQMGYTWKQARQVVDSLAACLILKRFLESK